LTRTKDKLVWKKIADKIKMTHLALVETKTVGKSDFRDRERNRAGVKRQQRILLEAPEKVSR
jgi:hypothetical protein